MFRFSKDIELSKLLRSAGLVDVIVRAFSFAHCLASPDELWNGILRGTVRTSIGIRRQPKAVQIRIRASKVRLPVMPAQIWNAQSAGLLSYFADGAELIRRTAVYVDKILKGAKAGDLPVEQPTKFELIINLKTARTLGLMIPIPLLARADQVID